MSEFVCQVFLVTIPGVDRENGTGGGLVPPLLSLLCSGSGSASPRRPVRVTAPCHWRAAAQCTRRGVRALGILSVLA